MVSEGCLRTGKSSWRVQNDAATGCEVHVERHVDVVVLGHAPMRGMHGDGRGVPDRIIIRDHTMNLPVVVRQPHPDHAPHTALRPPVAGVPNRWT